MNVRSRIQSCLVLLVVPAFCFRATQGSLAGTEKMTKVCGTVSMMSDVPERIKAAKLKFNGSDGAVVEVTANEMGEYQVLLKPETEYRVTMVAGRLCQLHRPGFRAESGATLKFDFVTPSEIRFVDWAVSGSARAGTKVLRPNRKGPYCDEETISFGDPPHELIIAYGIFSSEEDSDTYDALPISAFPGKYLPVAISYQHYTIRATKVEFNRRIKELTALGTVSISDGSPSTPVVASCVKLRLKGEPRPELCETQPDSSSHDSKDGNYYDALKPAMQGNLWNMWPWQSMPDSSLGGNHISM